MIIVISFIVLLLACFRLPINEVRDIIYDNYQIYLVYLVVFALIGLLVAKQLCKKVSIFLLFIYYYFIFIFFVLDLSGLIGFAIINPFLLFTIIGNTFIYFVVFFILSFVHQLIIEKYFCNNENMKRIDT